MLFLFTSRNDYSPEQCGKTMTIGELIKFLKNYDGDMPIYTSNDGGVTFSPITEYDFFREAEEYKGEDAGEEF